MSTMTQWSEGFGTAPGLRDALRSLIQSADDGDLWRLADGEITDSLADLAQVRSLLEVAEVGLVREGLERGLPSESAWSAHDWVTRAEGQRAGDPGTRQVAAVIRLARVGTRMAGPSALKAGDAVNDLTGAFEAGELPLGKADQLARFHTQLAPIADEEELDA